MWRMLTGRADDLKVELLEHEADGDRGSARWVAHYTFTQTGRPVENDVRASFRFADGLIAEHRDEFDFHRWSRQALGALACCSAGRRCCAPRSAAAPAPAWTSSWRATARPPR